MIYGPMIDSPVRLQKFHIRNTFSPKYGYIRKR